MSFDFIYEKDQKECILDKELNTKLVTKISNNYQKWQDARALSLNKTEQLIKEIFLKREKFFSENKNKKWQTKVQMCKMYMLYSTLKAFIWHNIYSKPNAMFDVSGENDFSDNLSNKQKAALVNVFEKMKFTKCLDKIIDNSLLYGDLIAFVGWKQKVKQVRRPISFFEKLLKNIPNEKLQGNYIFEDIVTYDNPYVYDVNPVNFVFDITQINDWDSCPKILKSFKTPEDILNNNLYKISNEVKDFLNAIVKNFSKEEQIISKDLKEELFNGDTIELLEHWGNIRLADGTLLKNYHVVVLARKYIIRFEKNKFVENPFVYAYYLNDPEIKRPISPLMAIYDLVLLQEKLYDKTFNMQTLNENPPIYAPKGFFLDDEIELYPGKIITYDPNLFQNVPITPMVFKSDIFMQDIATIDNIIAEVSGIYPNMSGQLDKNNVTATEINIKTQGQSIRLAMMLDIINQDLILPIVEKTAALLANFKYLPEKIYINKDGKNEILIIDNNVRQANYQYSYSDRNSLFEKYQNTENMALIFEKFGNVIDLNWQEIFKWYWEQKGIENSERFLLQTANINDLIVSNNELTEK